MKRLCGLIASHEDWLLNRILHYAKERGYVKNASSSLEGAWRMSVSGLSGLLLSAIQKDNRIPEIGPEEDYTQEPIASFVVSEAQRHRERGVTLGMFLSLLKCQRQCYKELISQSGFEPDYERRTLLFIERVFDRIEIYLCVEWVKVSERIAVEGVARDITERKKAEDALRISEASLRLITDNIIDMVSWSDSDFIYQYISPSHKSILGYEPEYLLGKSIFDFTHPKDITAVKRAMKTKSPGRVEFRCRHANGHYIWLESISNPLVEDGKVVGFIHVRRDITDRKEVEAKVKKYQEQLRSLAIKLTLVEQEERRRIASYLHDHIGQYLTIAKLELDALSESLTEIYLIEAITEIDKLIEKTIQCTRTLTFEISSPILYELGFEAGVKWLGEDLLGKRGVKLVFNSDKQPIQMDEEISVILFTAVRELLVNIVKHAKANRVSITIQKHSENIHILICDDGKGFIVSKKHNGSGRTNRFGLFSISERLKHLGGILKIESEPSKGTRAVLIAPLKL